MTFAGASRAALMAGILSTPFAGTALAQEATSKDDTVFVLGRIENGISSPDGETVSASSITADEMRKYDKASLDEAVDILPGVNASNTGGSRNERLIFVRGFDRFQTTLSIDGVRVYLPADNRADFGRFLTADLAEVQVSKGYVSVLNGPGAIGGAVNLVTRKPSRALEAELTATATGDGDASYNGYTVSGLLGTRNDMFYAQVSGATSERDSWSLSDDFVPVVPALEDGGERGKSASSDWRVNVKAGFTPNATDEYAISYIKQSGEKNAPLHISDNASTRFWTWPYWDIENIYFLSRTQLAPGLQLRSRVYYNTLENLLSSFDNTNQNTQTLPRAFDSYYNDTAYGANLTLEAKLGDANTLTGALHYRKDEHNEQQDGFIRTPASGSPFVNAPYSEPWQNTEEETWSIAVEDKHNFSDTVQLVVGASYDMTHLLWARDVNVSAGGTSTAPAPVFTPVNYPLKDMNAFNSQAALLWDATETIRMHASISSRARFPNLFERFSSRFGSSIPNPGVKEESAVNTELGASIELPAGIHVEGSIFRSDIDDALVQVPVAFGGVFGTQNQTRNVASAIYTGFELAFSTDVNEVIDLGANVTVIDREFDKVSPVTLTSTTPPTTGADTTNPRFEPQGVPDIKLFAYLNWDILSNLTLTPSLEVASNRWTVTSSSAITPPRFYETGKYSLLNLALDWTVSDNISVLLAAKNLTDENYTLVDGFPEEGRNVSLSLKLKN